MFSFLRKKADPPVTISPEPIKDDYVLVGSSTPQLPQYPPLNTPGTSTTLYPGVPNVDRRNSEPNLVTRQDSFSTKHNFAIDGVPFKLASNVQNQDVFTDTIREQMEVLRKNLEKFRMADSSLEYDFRTEKSVISGY